MTGHRQNGRGMPKTTAVVLGAGVVGLSCASLLLEKGWAVHVVARERTPRTTSDVAAAIAYPYLAEPADRVLTWFRLSLRAFEKLEENPATGIRTLEMVDLQADARAPQPSWADVVRDFEETAGPPHLPEYAKTWRAKVPLVPMDRYMPWLEKRCQRLGATFEEATLSSLEDVDHARVVNCTGLGARELVPDLGVYPVRGQIVRLENRGVKKFWCDDEGPRGLTYLIPRGDELIVGGTAQAHSDSLEPDPATEAAMIRRAIEIVPILRGAEVIGRAVGLRPGRPTVRLERERKGRSLIVHCYGHGGAGVSLSWGCAQEAVERLD